MPTERVILVHGLGSSHAQTWERFGWTEFLSDLGLDSVAFELPGHGTATASGDGTDERSPDALIRQAREWGARIGIGYSAGGVALLAAAVAAPDAFDQIVLLGVGDGVWEADHSEADLLLALESGVPQSPGHRLMLKVVADAGNDPRAIADYVRGMTPPPLVGLGRVRARTLVVIGDADPNGPAESIVQHLPNAYAVRLSGTDHYRTLTAPRSFAAVEDFLAEL